MARQDRVVKAPQLRLHATPGITFSSDGATALSPRLARIQAQELSRRLRERFWFGGQTAADALRLKFLPGGTGSCQNRCTSGQRFDDDVAETLHVRGQPEQIGTGE
ncbi:hypothetical protein BVG81_004500 [Haliangium sp. UPWRP_2]|nr:hypothetical protein BVG81_004500 [Haliangium sp. UPWRP_2]